jgi:hypothetical protein
MTLLMLGVQEIVLTSHSLDDKGRVLEIIGAAGVCYSIARSLDDDRGGVLRWVSRASTRRTSRARPF